MPPSTLALHFSAWKQNGGVDSLHLFLVMRLNYPPKSSISPDRDGTSYFPTTVEAVPWRRPCSSRTPSSVLTQSAHFSPACFASGSKCAFLASDGDTCAFDAPVSVFSHHEHASSSSLERSSAKRMLTATQRKALLSRYTRFIAGGKMFSRARATCAARPDKCGLLNVSFGTELE